jgi:acyl dehydratase
MTIDVLHVDAERIREFADAIGERALVHRERSAAVAAGYRDLVAPPMFAAVYTYEPLMTLVREERLGLCVPRMVAGGQRFVWEEPVCAGDVVETRAKVSVLRRAGAHRILEVETTSRNGDGALCSRGWWTGVERGGAR